MNAVPDAGTVAAAVELAVRAPSLHNSQPWRWLVAEHTVHLYADRERLLPVADPSGRELVISCGAVLHHARVAFAALGWRASVVRLPNPADPDHLASLEFERLGTVGPAAVALARAIARRRSDRRPFLPQTASPPLSRALLRRLAGVAWHEHGILTVADTDYARRELVVAMGMVNQLQRHDPAYGVELAAWAGRRLGAVEGVPASALRAQEPFGRPAVARDFTAAGRGELTAPPIDDGAVLAVLGTPDDDPRAWLQAGEALSAVLLTATARGLASCTLSQISEADEARDVVRSAVLGDGEPQLLLRLGWPVTPTHPAPSSPRRPLAEVLHRLPTG
jgi:nitroreductase